MWSVWQFIFDGRNVTVQTWWFRFRRRNLIILSSASVVQFHTGSVFAEKLMAPGLFNLWSRGGICQTVQSVVRRRDMSDCPICGREAVCQIVQSVVGRRDMSDCPICGREEGYVRLSNLWSRGGICRTVRSAVTREAGFVRLSGRWPEVSSCPFRCWQAGRAVLGREQPLFGVAPATLSRRLRSCLLFSDGPVTEAPSAPESPGTPACHIQKPKSIPPGLGLPFSLNIRQQLQTHMRQGRWKPEVRQIKACRLRPPNGVQL